MAELRTSGFAVLSGFAIILSLARRRLSCTLRVAAILSIVFGAYYLGHQQFYLAILVVVTVYIAEVSRNPYVEISPSVISSFAFMFGWLIFVQTGFELFDEFKPEGFVRLLPILSVLNSTVLISSGFYWLSIDPTRTSRTITSSADFPPTDR